MSEMPAAWTRELRIKKSVATRSALNDKTLGLETRAIRGELGGLVDNILGALRQGDVTCDQIRKSIKKRIPKKPATKRRGRQALNSYRAAMGDWVDGKTIYDYPPDMRLQNLGDLEDQNFDQYFGYFLEVLADYKKRVSVIDDLARDQVMKSGAQTVFAEDPMSKLQVTPEMVALRDQILGADSFRFQVSYPFVNLQKAFTEYAEKDEGNALRVFVELLRMEPGQVLRFPDLIDSIFKTLSGNEYFMKSFFNLVDEVFNHNSGDLQVDELTLIEFLRSAHRLGICDIKFDSNEVEAGDIGEPRTHHSLVVFIMTEGGVTPGMVVKTPAKYLPVSWNSHRLVDPASNNELQGLATNLEGVDVEELVPSEDVEKYEEGLKTGRRYYTNFARMMVDGIPGYEEEDEVCFHFFNKRDSMTPLELGVEVIINGASVVYFLNEDCELEMRPIGNVIPEDERLKGFPDLKGSDHIDGMFLRKSTVEWASEDIQEKIRRYILRYAYYLLVEKRSGLKKGASIKKQKSKTPFDLLLEGRDSVVEIPAEGGDGNGEGGSRKFLVRHDVDGFTRVLPEGQRHSAEAAERALDEGGITLVPEQTYVKRHQRGTVVAGGVSSKTLNK
jgi:hypothetical protein